MKYMQSFLRRVWLREKSKMQSSTYFSILKNKTLCIYLLMVSEEILKYVQGIKMGIWGGRADGNIFLFKVLNHVHIYLFKIK